MLFCERKRTSLPEPEVYETDEAEFMRKGCTNTRGGAQKTERKEEEVSKHQERKCKD